MFEYNKYKAHVATGILLVAGVLSGCQATPRAPDYTQSYSAGYNYTAQPTPGENVAAPRPQPVAATPAPVAQQPVAMPDAGAYAPQSTGYAAGSPQLEAAVLNLRERLERVEKAMLRLDRRMQLVEKNELSRMSGQTSELSGDEERVALRSLGLGPSDVVHDAESAVEGFRAVSSRGEAITSALQAAPRVPAFGAEGGVVQTGRQVAGLPSLADATIAPARGAATSPLAQMAIWTVKYNAEDTWPARQQLPSSKDIVDLLRQSGGMTLYARGKNANGIQFRERVKAISRYLAKVSSLDTVPIVAMAAPHLDDETIEILATH